MNDAKIEVCQECGGRGYIDDFTDCEAGYPPVANPCEECGGTGKSQVIRAECPTCRDIRDKHKGFGPSHDGSKSCESGSIASGGPKAHCACSTCF